ncbi:MAG: NifU family protein [Acidobacteriota bacterium]|nr:NifU family protein [Acidobacteriota bacterium]MDE3030902.1 NifU family protein [Acidobacteriota bacterium]MDE3092398.1 NifU family protein [Acidobacteriota bacterium]MDE3138608.1 NifU family protein [Acidobacteriota bacterium]MDE3146827.1 NifU family protein [Acidobacteriota bacterium]
MTPAPSFDVLALSDEARNVVLDALANEEMSSSLALWVEVTGTMGTGYTYDLYFSDLADAPEGAAVGRDGEITIVVPRASVDRLRGSRLEFATDGGGGLVLVNPNHPTSEELNPGVPAEILAMGIESELARLAIAVLDNDVNPSIASHGGRADLVAMDDAQRIAYIKMSGGCQGCSMSRMTLSQGIETALRAAIPELSDVRDITDHASGVNPFYADAH